MCGCSGGGVSSVITNTNGALGYAPTPTGKSARYEYRVLHPGASEPVVFYTDVEAYGDINANPGSSLEIVAV